MRASVFWLLLGAVAAGGCEVPAGDGVPHGTLARRMGANGEVPAAAAGDEEGCSPACWACERCVRGACEWDFEHCPCEERYGAGPEGACSLGCPADQLHLQLDGPGRRWLCGRFVASETAELAGGAAGHAFELRGQVPQSPFHRVPLCQPAEAGLAECAAGWVIR